MEGLNKKKKRENRNDDLGIGRTGTSNIRMYSKSLILLAMIVLVLSKVMITTGDMLICNKIRMFFFLNICLI
jgi:hypothetical protein